MRLLLILVSIFCMAGCTSMLLGTPQSGESSGTESRSAATASADTAISASIRERFSADSELGQYAIGIRTSGGRVTLSGTVGSYPLRDKAVQIARNTRGVTSVTNRISVNTRR